MSTQIEMVSFEDSNAAKWFCGFTLTEKTPDFSVFSRTRKRIGTKLLSEIFLYKFAGLQQTHQENTYRQ